MLVLNRRPGEAIVIGDNIKITAIETSRAGVRLGIDAPRDIAVHREEVAERIAHSVPMPPRPAVRQTRTYVELVVPAEFHGDANLTPAIVLRAQVPFQVRTRVPARRFLAK